LIECGTAFSIALRKPPDGCGPMGGRSVCRRPKQARLKAACVIASTRRSRASFLRPSYGPITQCRFSGLPLMTNPTGFFVRYASYLGSNAAVHTRLLIVFQINLASLLQREWRLARARQAPRRSGQRHKVSAYLITRRRRGPALACHAQAAQAQRHARQE